MELKITPQLTQDIFDGYGPSINLRTPFIVSADGSTLEALGKRIAQMIANSSPTNTFCFHFQGTDEEVEIKRAAQQIKDEDRILAMAAQITDRRKANAAT